MTTARVILTVPALSLAAAEDMANRFENDFRIEPLAVTINETDEAKNLWETVAYFATDADAEEAQRLLQLSSGIISESAGYGLGQAFARRPGARCGGTIFSARLP